MIIVDMLAYALDTPAPATIILISGDRDFVYAVSVLRLRKYRVVVVAPSKVHTSLKAQASVILDWDADALGKTSKLSTPPTSSIDVTGSIESSSGAHRRSQSSTGSITLPPQNTPRGNRRLSFREPVAEALLPAAELASPQYRTASVQTIVTSHLAAQIDDITDELAATGPHYQTASVQTVARQDIVTEKGNTATQFALQTPTQFIVPSLEDAPAEERCDKSASLAEDGLVADLDVYLKKLEAQSTSDGSSYYTALTTPSLTAKDLRCEMPWPCDGPNDIPLTTCADNIELPLPQRTTVYKDGGMYVYEPQSMPNTTADTLSPSILNQVQEPIPRPATVAPLLKVNRLFYCPTLYCDTSSDAHIHHSLDSSATDSCMPDDIPISPPLQTSPPGVPSPVIAQPDPSRPTLDPFTLLTSPSTQSPPAQPVSSQAVPSLPPIPKHFEVLIQVLEDHRATKVYEVSRGLVAQEITQRDPKVYQKVGIQRWKEYAAKAEKAGIVKLGGSRKNNWVSLEPAWHGRVSCSFKQTQSSVKNPSFVFSEQQPHDHDHSGHTALSGLSPSGSSAGKGVSNPVPDVSTVEKQSETPPANAQSSTCLSTARSAASSASAHPHAQIPNPTPCPQPESPTTNAQSEIQFRNIPPLPVADRESLPIPPHFVDLVHLLENFEYIGSQKPLRSVVANTLMEQNPNTYTAAGVKTWREFAEKAEKTGIVQLGGLHGGAWISLHKAAK
ncbi:hypothetical protein AcW2_004339 [Taiwanofungus camphoratus]|nr:hypothetical protein AcW2_004339 [Antrodia cinnamomea]